RAGKRVEQHVTRGVVGLLRLHLVVDHVVGDVDHRLVGIGAYGGTCVVLAHWILCMERGTGYFARAPFRKPRSAFVGVRAFTLRQLFCPGQRRQRAAALPKTPCRASVMIPLTTSGAASRAGATEQGAPHEVGLDPVVVAADAA